MVGWNSSVGTATRYWQDHPGIEFLPTSVVEPSNARVYGRSLAGVADSNPAGGMDACVVCCTGIRNMRTVDEKDGKKEGIPVGAVSSAPV